LASFFSHVQIPQIKNKKVVRFWDRIRCSSGKVGSWLQILINCWAAS
jgi:hypothetical protein